MQKNLEWATAHLYCKKKNCIAGKKNQCIAMGIVLQDGCRRPKCVAIQNCIVTRGAGTGRWAGRGSRRAGGAGRAGRRRQGAWRVGGRALGTRADARARARRRQAAGAGGTGMRALGARGSAGQTVAGRVGSERKARG